jgi:phenylpyruvate tautomerase PptA (4-oxalocrotonate tautomerase family)
MPMLDVYIPNGALKPDAEAALLNQICEIVIRHEGLDPADPVTRSVTWAFLHRPVVFVAGSPAEAPHYKVVPSVLEGQLSQSARAAVIAEITEAILDAENGAWPRNAGRVWVIPTEIPEGHWGGLGMPNPLATVLAGLTGIGADEARSLAAERIAASRAERARLP